MVLIRNKLLLSDCVSNLCGDCQKLRELKELVFSHLIQSDKSGYEYMISCIR